MDPARKRVEYLGGAQFQIAVDDLLRRHSVAGRQRFARGGEVIEGDPAAATGRVDRPLRQRWGGVAQPNIDTSGLVRYLDQLDILQPSDQPFGIEKADGQGIQVDRRRHQRDELVPIDINADGGFLDDRAVNALPSVRFHDVIDGRLCARNHRLPFTGKMTRSSPQTATVLQHPVLIPPHLFHHTHSTKRCSRAYVTASNRLCTPSLCISR